MKLSLSLLVLVLLTLATPASTLRLGNSRRAAPLAPRAARSLVMNEPAVAEAEPESVEEPAVAGPGGMSATAAAANPELASKAMAMAETIAALQAKLDGFPQQAGTMYCEPLSRTSAMSHRAPDGVRPLAPRQSLRRTTSPPPRTSWRVLSPAH